MARLVGVLFGGELSRCAVGIFLPPNFGANVCIVNLRQHNITIEKSKFGGFDYLVKRVISNMTKNCVISHSVFVLVS